MNPEDLQRAAVNTTYRRVAGSHLIIAFAAAKMAHQTAMWRCGMASNVDYDFALDIKTLFCGGLIFLVACVYITLWALVSRRMVPVPRKDEISDESYGKMPVVRRLAIAQERGRRARAIAAQINVFVIGVFSGLIGVVLYLFLVWQGVLPT